jgi:hypothetical protein
MIPAKATLLEKGTDCQSRDYDKTTRLENHDTPTESVCGRIAPRACNRTRGFSAQYHKSIAISSGGSMRAAVFGRRASNRCDTTTMMDATQTTTEAGATLPAKQTLSEVAEVCQSWIRFTSDTLFNRVGCCVGQIHGKKFEVSEVSRVIRETIVSVGGCAHTPGRRFLKSPLPPLTPAKIRARIGNTERHRAESPVKAETESPLPPSAAPLPPRRCAE